MAFHASDGPGEEDEIEGRVFEIGVGDEGVPGEAKGVFFDGLAGADFDAGAEDGRAGGSLAADLFDECFGDGEFVHGSKSGSFFYRYRE
jgi:hypothetical protein